MYRGTNRRTIGRRTIGRRAIGSTTNMRNYREAARLIREAANILETEGKSSGKYEEKIAEVHKSISDWAKKEKKRLDRIWNDYMDDYEALVEEYGEEIEYPEELDWKLPEEMVIDGNKFTITWEEDRGMPSSSGEGYWGLVNIIKTKDKILAEIIDDLNELGYLHFRLWYNYDSCSFDYEPFEFDEIYTPIR